MLSRLPAPQWEQYVPSAKKIFSNANESMPRRLADQHDRSLFFHYGPRGCRGLHDIYVCPSGCGIAADATVPAVADVSAFKDLPSESVKDNQSERSWNISGHYVKLIILSIPVGGKSIRYVVS